MNLNSENCSVCESRNSVMGYRLPEYKIMRCRDCGALFNADFPLNSDLKKTFSESYYMEVQKEAFEVQLSGYQNDPSLAAFQSGLTQIEQLLKRKGRILDVGSALGTFLKTAKTRGWEPCGVEISEYGANYTQEKHQIEVFNGELLDAPFEDEYFDCITFWDVIEHVPWPKQNLRKAYSLLKPGGALLITSDDYDCLLADAAVLIYKATLGRCIYGVQRLFIPYNRTYFTGPFFTNLIESCGFQTRCFEKMEYPLSKIKLNILERWALSLFYAAARLLKRQAQFTLIAIKEP